VQTTAGARVRPTPFAFLAVGWLLLIDLANRVSAGSISLAAVLSLGSLVLMAVVWTQTGFGGYQAAGFATPGRPPLPWPLALFAAWAVVGASINHSSEGVQNVTVYLCFILGISVTGKLCSEGASDKLLRDLQRVAWVIGVVYLGSVAAGGLGASEPYDARSLALTALVLLSVVVARRKSWLLTLLLLVDVGLSLSRTATLAAFLVIAVGLAVRGMSRSRLLKLSVLVSAGLLAAWYAFTHFAPLRDRFSGGDQAFSFGGSKFNVSGRSELWGFTWTSAMHHRWFGAGPGSADHAVLQRFVTVSHPHNDYLRLLHDFGFIGLALFVVGYLALMVRIWRLGRLTGSAVHWAAFLALLAVAITAFTDNVIIYPFVMIPLGVLVGASVSAQPPQASPDPSPRRRVDTVGARQL
jgi:O-antigen ligase/polysaccharide polymerase Wzy-like membrane protein